ncbi:hypothetical protein DBV10_09140 [Acidovorax sp. FJL06]|nr:hypothetical protein DBV10_09140 [Acidovorax sp. FJL06]
MGLAVEGAGALSLGAPQGQVWLGKPIDLGFEVQLDPGMSVDAACPQARLVSGDQPIPAGRVQVGLQPGEPGRNPVVRVQSSHLADEPVLMAQVSISCTGRVMREYTFLADLPPTVAGGTRPIAIPWDVPALEVAAPRGGAAAADGALAVEGGALPPRKASAGERVARRAVRRPSVSVARSPSGATVAPRSHGAPAERPQEAMSPAPQVVAKAEAQAEAKAPSPAEAPTLASAPAAPDAITTAAGPARPRLVMEPLSMLVTPAMSGAQSAPDAATLGAAQPSALVGNALSGLGSEGARMQALQAEIERMRAQAEQDRQATLALLARLEKVGTGYFPASLAYGLLGLLGLTMLAAAWGTMRMRRALDASNAAWRNTLTAYAAQAPVPPAGAGAPAHRVPAAPQAGQGGHAAALQGAG